MGPSIHVNDNFSETTMVSFQCCRNLGLRGWRKVAPSRKNGHRNKMCLLLSRDIRTRRGREDRRKGREWKEKAKEGKARGKREEGREMGSEREENRKGRGREKGRMQG